MELFYYINNRRCILANNDVSVLFRLYLSICATFFQKNKTTTLLAAFSIFATRHVFLFPLEVVNCENIDRLLYMFKGISKIY